MTEGAKPKVYRLRKIPEGYDRHAVGQLVSKCLHVALHDIHIWSLADTVDPWEIPQTQTATLTFDSDVDLTGKQSPKAEEWRISVLGLQRPLILDTHFEGLTPLNNPDPATHTHEFVDHLFSLSCLRDFPDNRQLYRHFRPGKPPLRLVASPWQRQVVHVDQGCISHFIAIIQVSHIRLRYRSRQQPILPTYP